MPKITYQELRPGKWFRLVDGQIVAAATMAEVAAWRRDNAAPSNIWQDVLKTARPNTQRAETSAGSTAQGSQQDSFWKDIVKPTKTQPRAESRVVPAEDRTHPLRPRGKEDIDVAEQASIWRDVLNQSKKRAPPTPPPAVVTPPRAKAEEKQSSARVAATERPAPVRVREPEQPVAQRAETKPSGRSAATKSKQPEKAKAPLLATKRRPTVTAAKAKPVAAPKVPSVKPKAHPAPKPTPPEKQPKAKVQPNKTEPASPSRRKPKAPAAVEPGGPRYLWMVAGQSDDLLATVRAGLTRYQQRFDHAAEVVLCHSEDLPALEGKLPVDLREGKSLPRRNIWIGLK